MATVAAFQLGHPIAMFILVEPDDALFHSGAFYLAFNRAFAPVSCFSSVGSACWA